MSGASRCSWYWNIRSFMFQVSICLTIYMGVMVLEVAPAILERLNWKRPLRLIHAATALIAGLGILLSSLHQSTLGSLFLLIPYKLHALWWTPLLPFLFFVSAAFAGLCMAILVASLSFQAFGRRLELRPLVNLASIAAVLLAVYLLLKLGDVILAGELGLIFTSGSLGLSFAAEILLGVALPIVLFVVPRFRANRAALIGGSAAGLLGIALNRTNVALLAYEAPMVAAYTPHWIEIVISLAAIAGGIVLFTLAAYLLPILPGERPVTVGWSRRTVAFVAGMLSLITIGVVVLTLPATEAKAVKNGPATTAQLETATCADCHQQPEVLATLVNNPESVAYLTIEPEPPEKVHGSIRCVTCHYGEEGTSDLAAAHQGVVIDPTLGEAQVCVACHGDLPEEFPEDRLRTPHDEVTHGEVSGVACSDCHGGVGHGFDPVSGEVICPMAVCLDCHQQLDLETPLTDCDACHIGPHDPASALDCSACHTSTNSWERSSITDHPIMLEGAHAEASCLACHTGTLAVDAGSDATCTACHNPPDNHLEGACDRCHAPDGWVDSAAPLTNVASKIPHDIDGKDDCLMCHDPEGNIRPALSTHEFQNEQCTICHKLEH